MSRDLVIDSAVEGDVAHVLHPSTLMGSHSAQNARIIERASGIRMWDVNGDEWIDAAAGQINVNLGYSRPEIAAAVAEALGRVSFASLYYGGGHTLVSELATRLAELTPGDLNHFFFASSGSEAVDTAIKFARLVNGLEGKTEKIHIIGRRESYHGMTLTTTKMSGLPSNWQGLGGLDENISHISQPRADVDGPAELEAKILEIGADKVAAFLAEPISAPGGFVIPPEDYWARIREICDKYDVLLIVDETVCGFGRTGKMFGIDNWGVVPDIMTMSKGINNGATPMGVAAIGDRVHARLAASDRPLSHGFTGGAHPAACAAALTTLDIIAAENVVDEVHRKGAHVAARFREAQRTDDRITDVRQLGLLVAVDVTDGVSPSAAASAMLATLQERRIIGRAYPATGTIVFAPALTSTDDELDLLVDAYLAALPTA
ncbi:aminotransferase family protein [Microbacterium gorillae]|uniref:aminotransferase family protein n=1 Tax=Microbacterium gorillae TaxID=1231063 RepID=UPI0006933649|nr:aminotransferase class III-fold pyridoxal phosphate-dependent enzyme [Microbacterium gorillae]